MFVCLVKDLSLEKIITWAGINLNLDGGVIMKDLKNWTEVTKGLYRYVIAANVCYELHILHWDFDTDILTAKASVFLAGDWRQTNGNSFFEREAILEEQPVFECLAAAEKDNNTMLS